MPFSETARLSWSLALRGRSRRPSSSSSRTDLGEFGGGAGRGPRKAVASSRACASNPRAPPRSPAMLVARARMPVLVDDILREAGLGSMPGQSAISSAALVRTGANRDRRSKNWRSTRPTVRSMTSEDVAAIIVDANLVAINGGGRCRLRRGLCGLDQELSRAFAEKFGADPILGAALRHAFSLADAKAKIETGTGAAQAAQGDAPLLEA